MIQPRIRAISFDLWDTLFVDDSDEPKRKEQGLPDKATARRTLVHEALCRHADIERLRVDAAYDAVDAAFRKVWDQQHVTWTVRDRLTVLLNSLGRELPPDELAELIRAHEEMELEVSPDLIPGVKQALDELHEAGFRLGVISDTVFSPGRTLRVLLEREGLLGLFDALVFSDEVLRSKPDPAVVLRACDALGVAPQELVHVGDRAEKDVSGPHAVGARAILCAAGRDRHGAQPTGAEGRFDDYAQLPALINELNPR